MMNMFDQREESFEKIFVHEEELHFLAEARRNKLLGLWVAEKLGESGGAATAYAERLVVAVTAKKADDIIVTRILNDFVTAGLHQSEHQIRRHMEEFLAQATAEIRAGM